MWWLLLLLAVLLVAGGLAAIIVIGPLFWKIIGFLMLCWVISTLRGKGIFTGKKDASL